MNALAFSCRLSAARKILTRSIATVLSPAVALFATAALTDFSHAADSATESGGILTDILGAAGDGSNLTTTTSGSVIQVLGTNFGPANFSGVTQIHVNFDSTGQTAEFDSAAFSFAAPVTITGGSADDQVVIDGSNAITFTGAASTYGGGTIINAGQVTFNNASAFGTGPVSLANGTELIGSGTLAFINTVNFIPGVNNATISATFGSTVTFAAINASNTSNLTFGSAGNTGEVVIDLAATPVSGTVTVADGTLSSGPGGGLGNLLQNATATTVDSGAKMDLKDNSTAVQSLQGTGTVNLGSKTTTVLTLTSADFGGAINGAGQVDIGGFTFFTGANTYTGGTNILAHGILDVGNSTTAGSIVGNVSLAANSGIVFDRTNAYSFAGVITGTGLVEQNGGGVLTLSGKSTYSGGTEISNGVLVVTNSQSLGTQIVTLDDGAELRATGTVTLNTSAINFANGTNNATISAAPGGTFTLNNLDTTNTSLLTFGSTGNTGTVVIGANALAAEGDITVAFGTLKNGGGLNALTDSPPGLTTVNTGATLAVNDMNTTIFDLTGSGSVTLGTKLLTTLTLDIATFSGVISGLGQVSVTGSSILTGANTYTGGTTITADSFLQLGNGTATGSIVGNVSIASGGALEFDRNNPYTFSGAISGLGFVEQNGTSILTLSGKNTYSGGTQITSGDLVVTNNNSVGTGPVTLSTGAELRASGTVTLNTGAINFANGTNNATISAAPGGTFTLNNLDTTNTSGLTIGSAGNTGTVVIGPAVTTGTNIIALTVAFGTLRNGGGLNALTNLSFQGGITTVEAGATLSLNDINTEIFFLQGAGSVNLGTKPATVLKLDNANTSGVISGAGQVNVAGATILTGANTYTGGTTITADNFLQLGNGTATGSIVGNVSIASGGTLEFDRSNPYTFGGVISGAGVVEQEGTSILTLSGNNKYSGGTQITSGDLVVTNNNSVGTGPVTLSSGAELRGSGTVTLNTNTVNFATGTNNATISAAPGGTFNLNQLDISNTAAITFGSAGNTGTVVIGPNAANTSTGNNVTVAFGTLRNGDGLSVLTDAANTTTVNAGATLDLHDIPTGISSLAGTGTVTLGTQLATVLTLDGGNFGGVISGAGQVEVSGPAVFTGNNTYKGGTTIDPSATLKVGVAGPTGSIVGNVSIGSGGELDFARTNPYTFSGIISGAGFVDGGEGGSLLTLTGNNKYQGGTKMAGGVLVVTNNNALGTGPVTLSTGAELRATGNLTLNTSTINFASGTTNATLSAAPGGTFTLNNLDASNTDALTFGSAGNTGTISLGSGLTLGPNLVSATVAFGTLFNGAEVSQLLANGGVETTVNAGATLAIADLNTKVKSLSDLRLRKAKHSI